MSPINRRSSPKEIQQAADSFLNKLYKTRNEKDKPLSRNECVALYGMIRYPNYRDKEVCDAVKLKISTLTAIKNRLKNREIFKSIRIPNFKLIGYNIVTFVRGSIDPQMGINKKNELHNKLANLADNIYFYMASGDKFSFIAYTENYTEIKAIKDNATMIMADMGALGSLDFSIYPIESIYLLNNFDFSYIVGRMFQKELLENSLKTEVQNLDIMPRINLNKKTKENVVHLTNFEKRVFLGLIKYADLPDKSVAEKIGITRQTVARMKGKFLSKNLLFNRKIPNIKKLGVGIVAVVEADLNPNHPIVERLGGIKFLHRNLSMYFWITSSTKSNFYAVFDDYKKFQEAKIAAESLYFKHDYLTQVPKIDLMSVNSLWMIKNFDAIPLLQRKFKIEI